jgi:hypothetical protein
MHFVIIGVVIYLILLAWGADGRFAMAENDDQNLRKNCRARLLAPDPAKGYTDPNWRVPKIKAEKISKGHTTSTL